MNTITLNKTGNSNSHTGMLFVLFLQVNHTVNDIAKLYTIPDDVVKKLFAIKGLPKLFTTNAKTFAEYGVLVRGPAIELIDYLKKADYNRPVIRYVLCILY